MSHVTCQTQSLSLRALQPEDPGLNQARFSTVHLGKGLSHADGTESASQT